MATYETARERTTRLHEAEEIVTAEDWAAVAAEDAADAAAARERAQSPEGRRDAAERKALAMDAAAIDSGVYTDDERASAWAAYRAIDDEIKAAGAARFAAEWPRDLTITRRAEMKARAAAGELSDRRGSVDWKKLRAIEAAQGWTVDQLNAATKAHGLA